MPSISSPPAERLDLYDESVPWSVRERHLRRYVDAVCWVMEYRKGQRTGVWFDLGSGTNYGVLIIQSLVTCIVCGIDKLHGRDVVSDPPQRVYRNGPQPVMSAIEFMEHLDRPDWDILLGNVRNFLLPGGCFVGTCPIGHDGPNPLNPYHLFEPRLSTLDKMLRVHFSHVCIELSTATLTTGERQTCAMFLAVP